MADIGLDGQGITDSRGNEMAYIHRTKEGVPYITSTTLAGWSNQVHHDFVRPLIDRGFLGLNGGAWIIRENHRGNQARVVCMSQEAGMVLLQSKHPKARRILIEKMRQAFEAEAERYQRKTGNPPGKRRYGLVDMAQPEAAQIKPDAVAMLAKVRADGIKLEVDGDMIYASPSSKVTDGHREIIKAHKPDFLRLLRQEVSRFETGQPQGSAEQPAPVSDMDRAAEKVRVAVEAVESAMVGPAAEAEGVGAQRCAADIPKSSGALVTMRKGQATTTTLEIAAGTEVTHEAVILSVRKYKEDLERFGLVEFKSESTAGRPTEYAILNERQATLLISYQRNTEIVRAFKVRLVEEFYRMAEELCGKAKAAPRSDQLSIPDLVGALEAAAKFNLAYIGMPKEQAVIGANHLVKNQHGVDYLALVQAGGMRATTQDVLITATLIGKSLGRNAQQVNELLCRVGLQVRFYDEKKNSRYQLTEQGTVFGEYVVECPPNKIEPVRYIKWRPSVIDFLESKISGEVA